MWRRIPSERKQRKGCLLQLMRPESQIKSYIEDALRSSVPKLTLDELFEKKDEIALEVQNKWQKKCQLMDILLLKP